MKRTWQKIFRPMAGAIMMVVVNSGAKPVGADQTTTPGPVAMPTSVVYATCPVGILAILPADKPEPVSSSTREFAAFLWSPDGPGLSTGTIWVNASGSAYDVRFTKRKVLSPNLSEDVDPITFRLPAAAHLENAFIASLADGDSPGLAPCSIFNPWVPSLNMALSPNRVARLREATTTIPAIDAEPIADPEHACHGHSFPATTLRNGPIPLVGERPPAPGIFVDVLVRLNADSSIENLTVHSTPRLAFDPADLDATRAAVFLTEVKHCRPVAATYVYRVEFNH